MSCGKYGVVVENAYKKYGKSPYVLRNLCMKIPRNQIYGLLGSSGCGKTTLLKSLVGCLDLDNGRIQLCVSSKKKIGFMPQETALFEEFTISETFWFYAKLYNLSNEEFQQRMKELSDILDLPSKNQVCTTLSGGQIRRVSIAMTLLHSPPLVILDEPTSGLDPLLAYNFWQYLNKLSVNGQTIIITTHYIEEARQANIVGLMRNGILLAEDSPERLITQYNVESLEAVFFSLSVAQEAGGTSLHLDSKAIAHSKISSDPKSNHEDHQIPAEHKLSFASPFEDDLTSYNMFWPHTKAIIYKNKKWVTRNWWMFFSLSFFLSALTIFESNECLKHIPTMQVGLLNRGPNDCRTLHRPELNCSDSDSIDLVCNFIDTWKKEKPDMPLLIYDNMKDAMKDGKSRKLVAVLEFPYNFTAGAYGRFQDALSMDNDLLNTSSVEVRFDSTDFMQAFKFEQDMKEIMRLTLQNCLEMCGFNPAVADIPPMKVNTEAFLGKNVRLRPYDYTAHIGMSVMVGISFIGPAIILTISLCLEKVTGAYTRCLVGGVKMIEIFSSYMILLIIYNALNIAQMGFVQFVIYGKPYGHYWLGYLLLNAMGFTGILMGFFTVVLTRNLIESSGICILLSVSSYTFSGFLWPIEAAAYPLITLISTIVLPNTLVLKSFSAVVWKNASLFNKQVYSGFLICLAHSIVYTLLIYLLLRKRKTL